jgi:hypothetical protein
MIRIDASRQVLFSGVPLPYVSLGPVQPDKVCAVFGGLPARRRACLPKTWVARVSRMIGNFDSTAKATGWQEGTIFASSGWVTFRNTIARNAKRHSIEWRFAGLHRSLASPGKLWAMMLDHRTACRLSRPAHPFPGNAPCAFALAGRLLCFRLRVGVSAAGNITGAFELAICGPFTTMNLFFYLGRVSRQEILNYGKKKGRKLQKTIIDPLFHRSRDRLYFWQRGQ